MVVNTLLFQPWRTPGRVKPATDSCLLAYRLHELQSLFRMRAAVGFLALLCFAHLCAADSMKNIPVSGSTSGTMNGKDASDGTFKGLLTITSAAQCGTQICMWGTITNGKVKLPGEAEQKVEDITLGGSRRRMLLATAGGLPLTSASGSCDILHLDLGPLDLNLLGLMVHLNEVKLDITAKGGNGNLLGNLLCSIANLLNGGSPLQNLVNQLLTPLQNLISAL